jgi:hypothetical protein
MMAALKVPIVGLFTTHLDDNNDNDNDNGMISTLDETTMSDRISEGCNETRVRCHGKQCASKGNGRERIGKVEIVSSSEGCGGGSEALAKTSKAVPKRGSSSGPESTLKKKHNAIAYHRVREAQAAKIVSIAHIEGTKNPADILTKSLPGVRLRELIQAILW